MTVVEARKVQSILRKQIDELTSLQQFYKNRQNEKEVKDLEEYCNLTEPICSLLGKAICSMQANSAQLSALLENQPLDLPDNLYWLNSQIP